MIGEFIESVINYLAMTVLIHYDSAYCHVGFAHILKLYNCKLPTHIIQNDFDLHE